MGLYASIRINDRDFHKFYDGPSIPSYVFKDGFQTKDLNVTDIYKVTVGGELMFRSLEEGDYFHYYDGDFNKQFNFYTFVFNPTIKDREWWSFDCLVRNGKVKQIILSECPNDFIKDKKEQFKLDFDKDSVEIDLPDHVVLKLALEAHEKDITLNQHINNILKDFIDKNDNGE